MGKRETTDANIAANSNIKEIFTMSSILIHCLVREIHPGTNCMLPCVLKVLNSTKIGWLVLLLYVPSQQLWSLRDGQFT